MFWVVYAYPVEGIAPGKRTPERVFVRATFPVEIRSVAEREAPETILIHDLVHPARPQVRRLHDDKLWKVATPDGGNARGDLADLLSGNHPGAAGWSGYPFRHPMLPASLSPFDCRPEHEVVFRTLIHDERPGAQASVTKIARSLVLVDGVLHRRCAEPMYCVGREEHTKAARLGVSSIRNPATGPSVYFRADRLAEARAFAAGVAASMGREDYHEEARIEILRPYPFSADERAASVRDCLWRLIDGGFGMGAGTEWLSVPEFTAWSEFRDEASAYLRSRGTVPDEASIAALSRLVEALPDDPSHPAWKFARTVRVRASVLLMRYENETAPHRAPDPDDAEAMTEALRG